MNLGKMMAPKGKAPPVKKTSDDFDLADVNKGLAEEAADHGAWATPAQLRKIVMDHLKKYGADYYGEEDKEHEASESKEEEEEEHEKED